MMPVGAQEGAQLHEKLCVGARLAVAICRLSRGLTFDMSGGAKGAKRPLGRPLDGGVRRHVACTTSAQLDDMHSADD